MSFREMALTPTMRKELDATPVGTLMSVHPDYEIVTGYFEGRGNWRQGDGEPRVNLTDPVAAQGAGRCAASRVRDDAMKALVGRIHPKPCRWCKTPTSDLLVALDHAAWFSRYVSTEYVVWPTAGDPYARDSGRSNRYENPTWAAFWALDTSDRRHLIESAMYGERAA